jgi:hypothetical protein
MMLPLADDALQLVTVIAKVFEVAGTVALGAVHTPAIIIPFPCRQQGLALAVRLEKLLHQLAAAAKVILVPGASDEDLRESSACCHDCHAVGGRREAQTLRTCVKDDDDIRLVAHGGVDGADVHERVVDAVLRDGGDDSLHISYPIGSVVLANASLRRFGNQENWQELCDAA